MRSKTTLTRRNFLAGTAGGLAGFTIIPRLVLGENGQPSANNKLNIAGIGVGGMGKSNLDAVCAVEDKENGGKAGPSENIVALCDVDQSYAESVYKRYPQAKTFKDYRVMLDKMGRQIDAVIIATPDHTHAVIAAECMKRGKHVYVQKPLTRTVYEARKLTEAARQYKVITQMGNQGHSGDSIRMLCEWIWDGAIGPVREVHAWTNRPVWPQGLSRPMDAPPVPETLDWDLWLGPAPYRPYNPAYHPWIWRAWRDFGTGALGDMACHILDPVFWALKLKYPTSVQGSYAANVVGRGKKIDLSESYPLGSAIHYEFPAREDMPPVKLHWYDGGLLPERPAELEVERKMGDENGGVIFIGDKGVLMCGSYGEGPRLIPETKMQEYKRPEKTISRISTSHEMHWVESCKNGVQTTCNFDYAGPFTETVVMGNLALFYPGQKLLWDGENMKVTNIVEANEYVNPPYRQGWSL